MVNIKSHTYLDSLVLTRNQIDLIQRLTTIKKPGREINIPHIIRELRSFVILNSEYELEYLVKVIVPRIDRILKAEYMQKVKTGVLRTSQTPTDVKGTFDKVENPECGKKYHVSWAYSGAVFILRRIDGDFGYMDNPKYKRKTLMRVKLTDLRHLAKHSKSSNPS